MPTMPMILNVPDVTNVPNLPILQIRGTVQCAQGGRWTVVLFGLVFDLLEKWR